MNERLEKAARYAIVQAGALPAGGTIETGTRREMRDALTALTLDRFLEKLWWVGISDDLAIDLTDSLVDMGATERSAYRKRLIGKGLSKADAATVASITAIDPEEMKAHGDVWVSAVWIGLAQTLRIPVVDAFLVLDTLLAYGAMQAAALVGSVIAGSWDDAEDVLWNRASRGVSRERRVAMDRAALHIASYVRAHPDGALTADECLDDGDEQALGALTDALADLQQRQPPGDLPFITRLRGSVTQLAPHYFHPDIVAHIQRQLEAEVPSAPPPAESVAPTGQRAA